MRRSHANGRICDGCDAAITPADLEHEADLSGGRTLRARPARHQAGRHRPLSGGRRSRAHSAGLARDVVEVEVDLRADA
jgi:hypothetical protein